jgi:LCP family protein required for cell wall assembly
MLDSLGRRPIGGGSTIERMSRLHELVEHAFDDDDPRVEPKSTKHASSRRRRVERGFVIAAVVLALLIGSGLVAGGLYLRSVDSGIRRVEAFDQVPEESRPQPVVRDAKNILVLGSDSRDPENTSGTRSDTIILAHLTRDRSSGQLISVPRDTWVRLPKTKDGKRGGGDAKINAAFALGGIPLVVQTMEAFTGVRVDHVVVIDFAGFKEIVDALGGVDIDVDQSFTSTHSLDKARQYVVGRRHMDGATALDYSRERFAFTDGDFTRIRHQQQVVKAVVDRAASSGLLTNPGRLNAFVRATSSAVSVDNTMSIFDMAMDLRHLRSGNLDFFTSPSKGTGQVGDESVVFPDTTKAKALYDAVRRDAVADIIAAVK